MTQHNQKQKPKSKARKNFSCSKVNFLGQEIIQPTENHMGTIIFFHGMEETNKDWLKKIKKLAQSLPQMKWILPQAPR